MADETQNMNDVTDEHEVTPQVKPLFPLPDLRQDATDDEEARSREEFTTVYDVIDQMEQSLDQAKGALFAPGLIKVDRDEFAEHLATLKKMECAHLPSLLHGCSHGYMYRRAWDSHCRKC